MDRIRNPGYVFKKLGIAYLSVLYELHGKANGYEDVSESHQHPAAEAPAVEALWRLGQPERLAGQAHLAYKDDIHKHLSSGIR